MSKKITRERFDEIKKVLNTPILVKPTIRYVADEFCYSSGTISQINRFDTFEEYKKYQKYHMKRMIENDMRFIKQEQEKAKIGIEKFNNEWFFSEVKEEK